MMTKKIKKKNAIKYLLFFSLTSFIIISCGKDNNYSISYLNSIPTESYYSNEIIPTEFQGIYGMWRLDEISGGFSGSGYETDFDFLEIKKIGIYGLIRNDSLFEYGKIVIDTFDLSTTEYLQIKFTPDFYDGMNSRMNPNEGFYIDISQTGRLNMMTSIADGYSYHFKKQIHLINF